MTAEEFTRWASSPEGIATLVSVGGVGTGTYLLHKAGVISWAASHAARRFKAGWDAEKPRAFVIKTAKATSLAIAFGAIMVTFDGTYAKASAPDQLTDEAILNISKMAANKVFYVSRADVYAAIVDGQSKLK